MVDYAQDENKESGQQAIYPDRQWKGKIQEDESSPYSYQENHQAKEKSQKARLC